MLCLFSCSTPCGFQLGSQQFSNADVVVSGVRGLGCFFNLQIQEVSWKILGWEEKTLGGLQEELYLNWKCRVNCNGLRLRWMQFPISDTWRESHLLLFHHKVNAPKLHQELRNHLLFQQMYLKHRPEKGTFVLSEYWDAQNKLSQKPHDGWRHTVYTHLPSCLSAAASHLYPAKWIG